MVEIATNRDLYAFIAGLVQARKGDLTLEQYLVNLQVLAHARCSQSVLSLAEFARLLDAAFETPTQSRPPELAPAADFSAWDARITAQIRDLREMEAAGTLANEYRYFGVNAPSGARWYNFDPCTFLECAAAGTFGGWEEGDDTGRSYVPGKVAVLDASGAIVGVDPRDVEDPVVAVPDVTWPRFLDFIESGQWYE